MSGAVATPPKSSFTDTSPSYSEATPTWKIARRKTWMRIIQTTLGIGLPVWAIVWYRAYTVRSLGNESFATGYALALVCVLLCSLGVRKRLVGYPIGAVSRWQTAHHWLGCICLIAYCLHAGIFTTGILESAIALLFWIILGTGFLSFYINRTSPRLLQAAGPAILRSDIPPAKSILMDDAYRLALLCAGNSNSSAIADLYRDRLSLFFQSPRSIWYRAFPNGKRRRSLLDELDRQGRYLDDDGEERRIQMKKLVMRRDDLDFQEAIQNRIRFCAIAHTVLLGAFIAISVLHVALAHGYSSHW